MTGASTMSGDREPTVDGTPLRLTILLLRHWRLFLWLPALAAIGSGVGRWLRGPEFTARSSFVPQVSTDARAGLSGLAAQFGVVLTGTSGDQSIDFYADLLKSEALLREAVLTPYRFAADDGSVDSLEGSVVTLYDVGGDSPAEQTLRAVDALADEVAVSLNAKSNIVHLVTTARWHGLAVQLNRRLLDLVNEFNLERRQGQAVLERQFVEQRLATASSELDLAESELEGFLKRNRRYQDSPQLAFEVARLQRRVDLRQQVYLSLAQAFEQARIEEVRNTPMITLVDAPEQSVRRSRGLLAAAVLGWLVGFAIAAGLAFTGDYWARQREINAGRVAELERERGRMMSALLPARVARFLGGGR